nr:MAG TPA: hypothetical protein [Caudoviricetes sp.]
MIFCGRFGIMEEKQEVEVGLWNDNFKYKSCFKK